MKKDEKIKARQIALADLIRSRPIEDQTTLIELIKDKYGIETNQSIISRDLREIGASKQKIGDKLIYEVKETDASREILLLAVVDVEYNESLIVIKTMSGLASFVGDILDMHQKDTILGTIAGENTVFVTPRSTKEIKKVYEEVCRVLYVKK